MRRHGFPRRSVWTIVPHPGYSGLPDIHKLVQVKKFSGRNRDRNDSPSRRIQLLLDARSLVCALIRFNPHPALARGVTPSPLGGGENTVPILPENCHANFLGPFVCSLIADARRARPVAQARSASICGAIVRESGTVLRTASIRCSSVSCVCESSNAANNA